MVRSHPPRARARAFAVGLLVAAICGLWPAANTAWAHGTGTSRGDYRQVPGGAEAWVSLNRVDLLVLAPALDANGNGEVESEELTPSDKVNEQLLAALPATRGDTPCPGTILAVGPDKTDGLFGVRYGPCEGEASDIRIRIGVLLTTLPLGHTQAAFLHVGSGEPQQSLVHGKEASVRVPLDPNADPGAPEGSWQIAKKCIVLGVEHIWFGIDHVVFLIGMVLLGGRSRDFISMVTSFTLAHSVTLALTVLGVVAPSPTVIEPLIALSVAYVGVENFIVKDISRRWRVAALFGLIHGFGFASAVGDKLPRENLPLALGTFNLGVELGQLALLLVFVPLFVWLRKREWFRTRGVQVLSAAVIIAGLYWFVERVFLS